MGKVLRVFKFGSVQFNQRHSSKESILQCSAFFIVQLSHPYMTTGKIMKMKLLSRVQLFATPWTVAYQAPPSMGFSRQECWNGECHFLLQGIFPTQELNQGLSHCRWILYHLSHRTLLSRKTSSKSMKDFSKLSKPK